jgi:flagella basal body P-ring formation protein FlgA
MDKITVTRSGATRAVARNESAPRAQNAAYAAPTAVIHRGDVVTLVYVAPGLQLTTRARATADAALGAPVKLINLQSNRTVDAIATGPLAASASGSQSF